MSLGPNAFQKFIHRFLMLRFVSALLARILEPLDELTLRITRGRRTVTELAGLPIVQLETLGARTGLRRSHPLVGMRDGHCVIVIGSNFGGKHHPAWVHNLRAHPECGVRVNGRYANYVARETEGDERNKYWQLALSYYNGYAAYEKRAAPRRIAVMVLEPKVE